MFTRRCADESARIQPGRLTGKRIKSQTAFQAFPRSSAASRPGFSNRAVTGIEPGSRAWELYDLGRVIAIEQLLRLTVFSPERPWVSGPVGHAGGTDFLSVR